MKYTSTRGTSLVSGAEAAMQGLAPDGGLYLPTTMPTLPAETLNNLPNLELAELAFEITKLFFGNDIPEPELISMAQNAFDFKLPIVKVGDHFIAELFHGPTLAFKDFAAKYMGQMIGYLAQQQNEDYTILVATSGDTGGAVAHGFLNVHNIKVVILYPAGRVSQMQERQMTTLGANIQAIAVEGTFDDCQSLVKEAFLDSQLKTKVNLLSANSINIARLIPQVVYYAYIAGQLQKINMPLIISVPSGNLGNLTAGIIATKIGIPISRFVAATNINDVVTRFLQGEDNATQAIAKPTLSNAMDIAVPSNLERLRALYDGNFAALRELVGSHSFDDEATINCIRDVNQQHGYLVDPHTAVGWLALEAELKKLSPKNEQWKSVVLSTAHPAKFENTIRAAGINVDLPPTVAQLMNQQSVAIQRIKNDYSEFVKLIL